MWRLLFWLHCTWRRLHKTDIFVSRSEYDRINVWGWSSYENERKCRLLYSKELVDSDWWILFSFQLYPLQNPPPSLYNKHCLTGWRLDRDNKIINSRIYYTRHLVLTKKKSLPIEMAHLVPFKVLSLGICTLIPAFLQLLKQFFFSISSSISYAFQCISPTVLALEKAKSCKESNLDNSHVDESWWSDVFAQWPCRRRAESPGSEIECDGCTMHKSNPTGVSMHAG